MPFGAVSASANSMRRFFVPMTRRTIGVAAALLMFVTTGGAFAAKRVFTPRRPFRSLAARSRSPPRRWALPSSSTASSAARRR